MQIAQILSGYSLGEADLLRRAMGKKIRTEMDAQRERFVKGATERGIDQRAGRRDLRPARKVRRLRLQQEPRRGLRAGRLPDRLSEGELSGRVPGRVDDARHGQHRQARRIPRRGRAARHQGRAAVGQPLRRRVRGRRQHASSTRSRRSRASARRRSRRSSTARGDRPFADLADFARRINPRAVNKRVLESLAAAGAFDALEPNRARAHRRASTRMLGDRAAHARGGDQSGRTNLFGGARSRETARDPGGRALAAGRAAAARVRRHRLLPLRPSARRLRARCSRACACSAGPSSRRAVKAGATAGRVAATVVSRMERRTKTGNKMGIIGLSDPSGHYEAVHVLRRAAAVPRPARARRRRCCCSSSAEAQGDEVRARIQTVEPLDQAAAKLQKGLRVFLRDQAPIEPVAKRLDGKGDGEVSMVLHARRRHRGRGEAARPLQGLAADRRRHQGGARAWSRSQMM